MPSKHSIKDFQPKTWYHVYNRGAYKNLVYRNKQDFWVFRKMARSWIRKNPGRITITPFALLENHFHFKLYQENAGDMTEFMRSIGTSFGMYISKKYDHSGHVFEGIYQAILLPDFRDQQRVRKYILSNPIEAGYLNWEHVGDYI